MTCLQTPELQGGGIYPGSPAWSCFSACESTVDSSLPPLHRQKLPALGGELCVTTRKGWFFTFFFISLYFQKIVPLPLLNKEQQRQSKFKSIYVWREGGLLPAGPGPLPGFSLGSGVEAKLSMGQGVEAHPW